MTHQLRVLALLAEDLKLVPSPHISPPLKTLGSGDMTPSSGFLWFLHKYLSAHKHTYIHTYIIMYTHTYTLTATQIHSE